jgi:hypothetical protein
VKLVPFGREREAGYRGVRHAPFVAPEVSCLAHPAAQVAGQHGNARHG